MILARFPAWEPFVTFIAGPDGSTAVVEFQVPCPSGAVERGLWVATDGGELTVGFHTHHTHFGMFIEDDQPQQIKAGLDHAGDMLDERIGVVSWYCGGCFAGSSSLDLPRCRVYGRSFRTAPTATGSIFAPGRADSIGMRTEPTRVLLDGDESVSRTAFRSVRLPPAQTHRATATPVQQAAGPAGGACRHEPRNTTDVRPRTGVEDFHLQSARTALPTVRKVGAFNAGHPQNERQLSAAVPRGRGATLLTRPASLRSPPRPPRSPKPRPLASQPPLLNPSGLAAPVQRDAGFT